MEKMLIKQRFLLVSAMFYRSFCVGLLKLRIAWQRFEHCIGNSSEKISPSFATVMEYLESMNSGKVFNIVKLNSSTPSYYV